MERRKFLKFFGLGALSVPVVAKAGTTITIEDSHSNIHTDEIIKDIKAKIDEKFYVSHKVITDNEIVRIGEIYTPALNYYRYDIETLTIYHKDYKIGDIVYLDSDSWNLKKKCIVKNAMVIVKDNQIIRSVFELSEVI